MSDHWLDRAILALECAAGAIVLALVLPGFFPGLVS
jgi:hypothetical protein